MLHGWEPRLKGSALARLVSDVFFPIGVRLIQVVIVSSVVPIFLKTHKRWPNWSIPLPQRNASAVSFLTKSSVTGAAAAFQ